MFALGASTPLMMVEAEESIILEQSLILVVTDPFKLIALCHLAMMIMENASFLEAGEDLIKSHSFRVLNKPSMLGNVAGWLSSYSC